MKELKFIHTADWHWGAHNAHPIYSANSIIDLGIAALTTGCKLVLVAGDIFDKPNPNQRIKDHLVEQLLPFINKLHFVFLVGNHDYTTKSKEYHCINYLKYFDRLLGSKSNIHVIEPGENLVVNIDGILVSLFGMDEFGDLSTKKDHKEYYVDYDILMWHGTLPGLDFSNKEWVGAKSKKAVKDLIKQSNTAYLAMGDIHKNIQIGERCAYSGPHIQKGYEDSCGVNCVSLHGENISIEHIDLGLPKKIVVRPNTTKINTIVEKIKNTVPYGSILRVAFELPLEEWAALNKEKLMEKLSKNYVCNVYNSPVSVVVTTDLAKKIGKSVTIEDDIKILTKELCDKTSQKDVYKLCTDIVKGVNDSTS